MRACVAAVLGDLRADDDACAVSEGLVRFFAAVFAPDVTQARQVAARIGAYPTTLTSQFFRAGLPSPRRYVGCARLVWAARIGEAPALSVSTIANRLDASSPQAYARTVRALTGLSPSEFRSRFTGAGMLDRFRATLVAPYRDTLRAFDPTGGDPPPPALCETAAACTTPELMVTGRAA